MDIISILEKLNVNKSPGPDAICPRVLYEMRNQIAYPLMKIFNCSIRTNKLPKDWKKANITAIFKKGKKSDVNNYRPVSLTCIICKLLESLIKERVLNHFMKNKLFTNKQFGFLKGRSTVTQLLTILNQWTDMLENGGRIDVVYTDLEKAFDKIPYRRLVSKLHSYGINKDIILWIEEFLKSRKQRVVVNMGCIQNGLMY